MLTAMVCWRKRNSSRKCGRAKNGSPGWSGSSRNWPTETQRSELRLLIGKLEEFTAKLGSGLEAADWLTRREIVRALVKQIEVSNEQVRIVYRVQSLPFVDAPNGDIVQDCRRRPDTF